MKGYTETEWSAARVSKFFTFFQTGFTNYSFGQSYLVVGRISRYALCCVKHDFYGGKTCWRYRMLNKKRWSTRTFDTRWEAVLAALAIHIKGDRP